MCLFKNGYELVIYLLALDFLFIRSIFISFLESVFSEALIVVLQHIVLLFCAARFFILCMHCQISECVNLLVFYLFAMFLFFLPEYDTFAVKAVNILSSFACVLSICFKLRCIKLCRPTVQFRCVQVLSVSS